MHHINIIIDSPQIKIITQTTPRSNQYEFTVFKFLQSHLNPLHGTLHRVLPQRQEKRKSTLNIIFFLFSIFSSCFTNQISVYFPSVCPTAYKPGQFRYRNSTDHIHNYMLFCYKRRNKDQHCDHYGYDLIPPRYFFISPDSNTTEPACHTMD